jgi:4-carboxymuconolactone decarboxylase
MGSHPSQINEAIRPSSPRIRPLPPGDRDAESKALIDSIGSSATDNFFDTLVRHPNLLRRWMPFTVALAVNGELPARLRELTILRTGWNCRAEYEWGQHAVLARKVGISGEEIARVKSGPEAAAWTELEAAMLRAADELHSDACVTDDTWAVLAANLDERQLIEVPMLVGQYHLVSFTLNTLGIERDPGLVGFDDTEVS